MSEKAQLPNIAQLIAHRGFSKSYTENSIAAFTAAAERDYFGIETDIRRSRDGVFIAMHDPSTRRVSGSNLNISQTDFSTLSKVRLKAIAGKSSELKIPTLKDYIGICKQHGKLAVIELKECFRHRDISELCKELAQLQYLQKCIFISFEFENLFLLRLHCPNAAIQYLVKKNRFGLLFRLKLHKMDLDIKYSAVTPELIKKCHALGIKVNCWTVDKPAAAKKLISMGVDYITTNTLEPNAL